MNQAAEGGDACGTGSAWAAITALHTVWRFSGVQWGRHVASKICARRNREGLLHEPRAQVQRRAAWRKASAGSAGHGFESGACQRHERLHVQGVSEGSSSCASVWQPVFASPHPKLCLAPATLVKQVVVHQHVAARRRLVAAGWVCSRQAGRQAG